MDIASHIRTVGLGVLLTFSACKNEGQAPQAPPGGGPTGMSSGGILAGTVDDGAGSDDVSGVAGMSAGGGFPDAAVIVTDANVGGVLPDASVGGVLPDANFGGAVPDANVGGVLPDAAGF